MSGRTRIATLILSIENTVLGTTVHYVALRVTIYPPLAFKLS